MRNRILLVVVLLAAAWLRFAGLDWDRGHGFHPFEHEPAHVARVVSAVASLAAVLVGWRFGFVVGGAGLGLLFAALLAFAGGLIQAAHFGTRESLLVLWLLLVALATARLARDPTSRWKPALAIGCFALLAIPALACAVVPPQAFTDADAFRQALRAEYAIATGAAPPGFSTLQFRNAPLLRFELSNLHWLAGPLVPVLGAAGLLASIAAAWRDARWRPALPFAVFGVAYGLYLMALEAKFARYQIALVPALSFGAAWAIVALHARWPRVAKTLGALVVVTSLIWAFAVAAIYRTRDPRLVASAWLLANAPPGSVIVNERRDVALPITDAATPNLVLRGIDGFTPESDAKLATIAQELAAARFLVLASDRIDAPIRANADLFPDTATLYRKLLAGELGYERVARFESLPGIGPVRLRDELVEESIRAFDHPRVLIFLNKGRLSAADLVAAVRAPTP